MASTGTPPLTEGKPSTEESHREKGEMNIMDVLAKLEKHEAECTLRYQRIDEKLSGQKLSMKALDVKIWGLAVLIIIAPMVHKFLA
tara:strand:- start:4507 stop:4764 length:258 start_codon:yes stop_codon:yes gene_type:complete